MREHIVGFDPVRVGALARSVAAAVADLRAVRSSDPTATIPLRRVAGVCFDLDTTWLPAIVAVARDTSMVGWDTAAPAVTTGTGALAGARPTAGGGPVSAATAAVIEQFDTLMAEVRDGDLAALDELVALLSEHADDAVVTSAVVAHLGPTGYFDALLVVAAFGSAGADCAELLADALDTSGLAGDPTFGAALGAAASARMVAPTGPLPFPNHTSAYAVTSFLIGSGHAPEGFELAVAMGVTAHAAAGGAFVEAGNGAPNDLGGLADVDFAADPVAASLTLLAAHPADAAAFARDAVLARYVFVEHEFHDGYTGLLEWWAAACAGPDLTDPSLTIAASRAHEANVIATRGVAWLAARAAAGRYAPSDASERASAAAASVVTVHMVAVERTVVAPGVTVDLAVSGAVEPDLPSVQHDALGPRPVEVAVFDSAGLDVLVATAGMSDRGLAIVRAGSLTFHQHTATGVAALVAAELVAGTPAAVLSGRVERAVATAGHVEGYLLETMWHQQQAAGRSQDRLVVFWVDGAEAVAGRLVGLTPARLFTVAVPVLGGQLTAHLATAEATAVADATAFADAQAAQLSTTFVLALADAGVITVPGSADGSPTAAEFAALTPAEQTELWSALEHGTAGSGVTLTPTTARDAIKIEQADLYDALPR